ncbi:acyl carrier protein [Streptomyces ureilyticus]|uniref:Acyl carrier protein n=1 Tax=Streptomyces ureilyticus TaxID=1775131 RepID=A0ABX0E9S1_9ACTN|nr:acyl carrier protein [Streptomyces ureilyticus]NGO48587.1 acyl carrier protein [Streptomyces ureilyticus]
MCATYDDIVGILVEELGQSREELSPETTFRELGIDSLALLELSVIVEERTGILLEGVTHGSSIAEAAAALGDALAPAAARSGDRPLSTADDRAPLKAGNQALSAAGESGR